MNMSIIPQFNCKYIISVLLSTYNGDKYLKSQLDSVFVCDNVCCRIFVRDDGSSDRTQNILDTYQECKKLTWIKGENIGPARSFMELLYRADEADYYSFCDQDDVWQKDKLSVAIDKLSSIPENIPALYFSEKTIVDKDLMPIKDTHGNYLLTLGESFINNPVTGCTMVINKKLRDIIVSAKIPDYFSLHDSWIYRICLAVGGVVIYDRTPHILYRQHGNNVVGHIGLFKRMYAFVNNIFRNTECARSKVAYELLNSYNSYMTDDNKMLLEQLSRYKISILNKLRLLINPRMRTHSWIGTLTFRFYVLFNRY